MGASFRSAWGGDGGDGGKPTSRGLPPAAFWGMGEMEGCLPSPKKGFPRDGSLGRVRAEPAVLPAGQQGENAAAGEAGEGLRVPWRADKAPLMRKALVELLFPRYTYIRRATLQRFCPQGKQRRMRTPQRLLARQGKAASFPRPAGMRSGINALWRGRSAPLPESEATQIEASAPVRAVRKRGRSPLCRLL